MPSSLSLCPEQDLGTSSASSPTTPRGSSFPRHSNMPRIIEEENTTSALTPEVTGTSGMQGCKKTHPANGMGSYLSEWYTEQTLGTSSEPSSTTPRRNSALRCSNNPRITGSQELGHIRISGFKRQLDY